MNISLRDQLASSANHLIEEIQVELRKKPMDRSDKISDDKLVKMINLVQDYKRKILEKTLPPKHLRYRILGRIIVDSWPLGTRLGDKIVDFEERCISFNNTSN